MLHIILLGTKIKKSHNLVKGMRLSNIRCPGYRVTCTASLLFLGFQFQLDRLINNQIPLSFYGGSIVSYTDQYPWWKH